MAIERIIGEREVLTEREQEFKDALEDMVWQFAYRTDGHGSKPPALLTGGLSSLEHAFSTLGYPDPYPRPDASCDVKDCQKWPQAGMPFLGEGDYLSVCSDHAAEIRAGGIVIKKRGRGYNKKQQAERRKRFKRLNLS